MFVFDFFDLILRRILFFVFRVCVFFCFNVSKTKHADFAHAHNMLTHCSFIWLLLFTYEPLSRAGDQLFKALFLDLFTVILNCLYKAVLSSASQKEMQSSDWTTSCVDWCYFLFVYDRRFGVRSYSSRRCWWSCCCRCSYSRSNWIRTNVEFRAIKTQLHTSRIVDLSSSHYDSVMLSHSSK